MRRLLPGLLLTAVIGLAGCSSGPVPEVATAYGDRYGAVDTPLTGGCPEIVGVWHLGEPSAGSVVEDGQLLPHFRWAGPFLFNLAVAPRSYIAIEPRALETVYYLANQIPGPGGRSGSAYTALAEVQTPCVGHGWRQVATHDHSSNSAAARVLGLDPEVPRSILQTDYIARTADDELVLAIHIQYSGTDLESAGKKKVETSYWHWMKMPRLHEDPEAQGFHT